MSNIRVDQSIPIYDGLPVTFKSPADCSQVTGLIIYYPDGETTTSKVFQFADAHGNNIGNLDLFAANAVVKVILDTDTNLAFVQNADTNAYLESRFDGKANNPNLLDNWYWVDPDSIIDQQGGYVVPPGVAYYEIGTGTQIGTLSTYSNVVRFVVDGSTRFPIIKIGGVEYFASPTSEVRGYTGVVYTIDRWKRFGGTTLLNDGYITLLGKFNNLDQSIDKAAYKYLRGKTVTMSVLGRGDFTIVSEDYTNSYLAERLQSAEFTIISLTLTVRSDADRFIFHIQPQDENPCDIIASKLELGDKQTLARQDENGNWVLIDPPPDRNMELLKCCMSTADPSDEYANNRKTADAINALALDGSKAMTGDLAFQKGQASSFIGVSGDSYPYSYYGVRRNDDGGKLRQIMLHSRFNSPDIKTALMLTEIDESGWKEYPILHTGNKPSGSYTGNGDATARKINTGGIGNALIIYSVKGIVIVTANGAYRYSFTIGMSGVGAIFQSSSVVTGSLTITSADECLNASSVTYYYQVL